MSVCECVFPRSCITLTVRLGQGTAEAVMFLSLHSSKVLLLGLLGSAHLQLHRERDGESVKPDMKGTAHKDGRTMHRKKQ